jgi:thiosulfate reductase cytochrome b subunit
MKDATKRSILRWIHLVLSIPIIGYIYSPFDQIPHYAPATRYVFVPIIVLSGLWMWKGHVVRRFVSKVLSVTRPGSEPPISTTIPPVR